MEIIFKKFTKTSEYQSQRELFLLSFPETIGTSAETDTHYHWKFESSPSLPHSYEYVAKENEDVIGYYGALPYEYQIAGVRLKCGMVCDVMTHPNHRRKGIFTKIGSYSTAELKKEGLAFSAAYPIRPKSIPGHLKVGWKIVHKLPMYLCLLGVTSFLPRFMRHLGYVLNPLIRFLQLFSSFTSKDYGVEIINRNDFFKSVTRTKEYERFFDNWLKEQKNALIKNIDFLKWRTGAPGTEYKFILLKRKHELVGFSLVRPTQLKGINVLAILDMMIYQDEKRGIQSMHKALKKTAIILKKDAIVCMCSGKSASNLKFHRALFIKTPATFFLILKKFNDSIADTTLFTSNNWNLFWIDSDDL